MNIHVKFFGILADIVGRSEININEINDTASLKEKILNDFPKLREQLFVIAVSKQIAMGNQKLKTNDVVALLPPFSGG